jgi:hypothetical protein
MKISFIHQETNQILTHTEEKELVKWITHLTVTGCPPQYATLREMAEEISQIDQQ